MRKIFSIKNMGFFGIVCPIIAFLFISISIGVHPWFSFADNALSDLGAVGTSHNVIFNFGLVLSGSTGLIFVLGLSELLESRLENIGGLIFGIGTFSLVMIGVFPKGTSPHFIVSVIFYALCTIGMILIGFGKILRKSERIWGIFVLSIVLLGLISVSLVATIPYGIGAAIPEIIGALVFGEFTIIFGARLAEII